MGSRELHNVARLYATEKLAHLLIAIRLVIHQHALFLQRFGQLTRSSLSHVEEIGVGLEIKLLEKTGHLVFAEVFPFHETAVG